MPTRSTACRTLHSATHACMPDRSFTLTHPSSLIPHLCFQHPRRVSRKTPCIRHPRLDTGQTSTTAFPRVSRRRSPLSTAISRVRSHAVQRSIRVSFQQDPPPSQHLAVFTALGHNLPYWHPYRLSRTYPAEKLSENPALSDTQVSFSGNWRLETGNFSPVANLSRIHHHNTVHRGK